MKRTWPLVLLVFAQTEGCGCDDGARVAAPPLQDTAGFAIDPTAPAASFDARVAVRSSLGQPLPEAVASVGGAEQRADARGELVLAGLGVSEPSWVTVRAPGHAAVDVRLDFARYGQGSAPALVLRPLTETAMVDARAGGRIDLGRARVNVAPGALVRADGSPYDGMVKVSADVLDGDAILADPEWVDVASLPEPFLRRSSPGVRTVALARAQLTLEDASGAPLAAASDAALELDLPLPDLSTLMFDEVEGATLPLYTRAADFTYQQSGDCRIYREGDALRCKAVPAPALRTGRTPVFLRAAAGDAVEVTVGQDLVFDCVKVQPSLILPEGKSIEPGTRSHHIDAHLSALHANHARMEVQWETVDGKLTMCAEAPRGSAVTVTFEVALQDERGPGATISGRSAPFRAFRTDDCRAACRDDSVYAIPVRFALEGVAVDPLVIPSIP